MEAEVKKALTAVDREIARLQKIRDNLAAMLEGGGDVPSPKRPRKRRGTRAKRGANQAAVLEVLTRRPQTIADIGEKCGLKGPSLHVTLANLKKAGKVDNPERGQYKLAK